MRVNPYELHPETKISKTQRKILTWDTVRDNIINMMKAQEGRSSQTYQTLHGLLKELEKNVISI